jgi:SH3 domain-containing protein
MAVNRWLILFSNYGGLMLKEITAAACLCATIAQAQSSTLSGQQINELVAGATVEIDTPLGTKLPVRYTRDGRLSGEAGDLASYLGTASDKGRWWVASDQLCHKWNRWFGSEPQCLRLSREGRTIYWRSQDGYVGTAMISVPPPVVAEAVPPRAEPDRAKETPQPKMMSAPASKPEERPPQPATAVDTPPQEAVKAAVAEAAPEIDSAVKAPPAPVPATRSASPPPQPQPEPKAEPKHASQPVFRVVNVRSDDVLNVRSGPSADFEIVGGLPPGSHGIAITSACRSTWCPVQHRAASGWVNSAFLAPEEPLSPLPRYSAAIGLGEAVPAPGVRDAPEAPRTCLTAEVRALLDRIERQFGPVKVISTCRPGSLIPGTAYPSRHASGNAVDFLAGSRKAAIVEWLIANHRVGGTMTYAGMDHIHMDIGPRFVSIAKGPHWLSWRDSPRDFPRSQPQTSGAN